MDSISTIKGKNDDAPNYFTIPKRFSTKKFEKNK